MKSYRDYSIDLILAIQKVQASAKGEQILGGIITKNMSSTREELLTNWTRRTSVANPFVSGVLSPPVVGEDLWVWEAKEEYGYRLAYSAMEQKGPISSEYCISPVYHNHIKKGERVVEADDRVSRHAKGYSLPLQNAEEMHKLDIIRLLWIFDHRFVKRLLSHLQLGSKSILDDIISMYSTTNSETYLDLFYHILTVIQISQFPCCFYLLHPSIIRNIPILKSRKNYLASTPARVAAGRILTVVPKITDAWIKAGKELRVGWHEILFDLLGSTMIEFGQACREITSLKIVELPGPAPLPPGATVCHHVIKKTGKLCKIKPKEGSIYCYRHQL